MTFSANGIPSRSAVRAARRRPAPVDSAPTPQTAPATLHAAREVVAALLRAGDVAEAGAMFEAIRPIMAAADLAEPRLSLLFTAIEEHVDDGLPITLATVADRVSKLDRADLAFKAWGGDPFRFIAEQLTGPDLVCPSDPTVVAHHARIVARSAAEQRAREDAEELGELAQSDLERYRKRLVALAGEETSAPLPTWQSRVAIADASWYSEKLPEREWLLRDARRLQSDGFLLARTTGLVVATGGTGKTQALTQLAVAVTTGDRWLGTFTVERPGRVFLLFAEETAEEARRRIYHGARGQQQPPPQSMVVAGLRGVSCALLERGNQETTFARELKAYLQAAGPWSLIVLDPLSRLAGPEAEIDNFAATRFVEVVESIAELTGATVLVSHHASKAPRNGGGTAATQSRGVSALTDGVRWQVTLTKFEAAHRKVVAFSHGKSNYSAEAEQLLLQRSAEGLLVPLTDGERAEVEAALSGEADRKAKGKAREREAEEQRAKKAAQLEEARAEQQRKREAETSGRRIADDLALIRVLRERPGITSDELRSTLAARLGGCSRDRMKDALARLGAAVEITTPPGAKAATKAHRLVEANLRPEYRG